MSNIVQYYPEMEKGCYGVLFQQILAFMSAKVSILTRQFPIFFATTTLKWGAGCKSTVSVVMGCSEVTLCDFKTNHYV